MNVKIKKYLLRALVSTFVATWIISFFSVENLFQNSLNLKSLESGLKKVFDKTRQNLTIYSANADTVSDGGGGGGCGGTSSASVGDAPNCNCSSSDGGGNGSGGGSGACGDVGCFTYCQKVSTPNGAIEIGKLKIGDKVISYDEKENKFTISIIEKIAIHNGAELPWHDFESNPLIELTVENGNEINSTEVTQNHRYYDPKNDLYKDIAEFKVGDRLKTYEGAGVIQNKRILIDKNNSQQDKNQIVYNLHTENAPHNYLVNGIVVHNIK